MSTIRHATVDDLEKVRQWLQQEKDDGHDSFINNFNMIADGRRDGFLTVFVDDIPIAFALGEENLSIVAVKRDRRKEGVGRKLVAHWIRRARRKDRMGLVGECSPATSLWFWKKMGCQQVQSRDAKPFVILPFCKTHKLPAGARTVELTFELHAANKTAMPGWGILAAAVPKPEQRMLGRDFVAYVPDGDARVAVREYGVTIAESRIRDVTSFGGERSGEWIRIRNVTVNEKLIGLLDRKRNIDA